MAAADAATAGEGAPPPPSPRRPRAAWPRRAALALVVLVGLVVAVLVGAREAVRTGPGRAWLTHRLDGLALGPVGRLRIAGLAGDPLGDFTLRSLQIVDAQGVWLEGRDLALRWRPGALFARRFHAERLAAATLTVLRPPAVTPQPPSKGPQNLPIAVQIDDLRLGLETSPAFSVRRGSWTVAGQLALERDLSAAGRVSALSRLRAGDGLAAQFQLGQRGRLQLRIDAAEAGGGALAGALGLPADQRLAVKARADGTADAGGLQVETASGARSPLTVQANWAGGASRLNAHLDLAASRLTRFVSDRAGPVADLTLNARHMNGDVFQIDAGLVARAASLAVHGPLDWRKQTTQGLNVEGQVADVARWAPGVTLGSAKLQGVLGGGASRFDFKGALAADRFAQSGYALARIAGPLSLSRNDQQVRVQADLRGQGGAGAGAVLALLGAAPHVTLDAARLADGRLLVRRLDAVGAGLKLSAQGGQALLGDLSFKGSAQVSNLAAVQKGARGVLRASWTASQSKGQLAWRFGVDAGAGGFALGVAQADHFIGPSPRLTLKGAYGPGGLDVASAQLTGAALSAGVRGRLDAKGGLGLALDWAAKGPFDAGPLEVAGSAKGSGRIGGTLTAPTANLGAQVASLALGRLVLAPANLSLSFAKAAQTLGGTVALTGPSSYGPASVKAAFQLAGGGGVDVRDLLVDAGGVRASGALALRDSAPSTADLKLSAGPGAFLSRGQLSAAVRLAQAGPSQAGPSQAGPSQKGLPPARGAVSAHIALDGHDLAAPGSPLMVHAFSLHADGPWSRLPFRLSLDSAAPTPVRFAGVGVFDQSGPVRAVSLSGAGQARGVDLKTLAPAMLRFGDAGRDLSLRLGVGASGRADVDAHQDAQAATARARLTAVNLSTLDPDYVGAIDADLSLTGRGPALGGAMTATLRGARSRDAPANLALDGKVRADLAGSQLRIAANAGNTQGLTSTLTLMLPVEASAAPFRVAVARTRPMSGTFQADGELRPLWDLLVGGEQTLSGRLAAQGAFGGTLNAPQANGQASLTAGRLSDVSTGLNLQDLTLKAGFNQGQVRIDQASGADGHGGTMSGSGAIGLAKGGGSSFKLHLARFRAIDNDLARASVSGDVTVTRDTAGSAKVLGALQVDRADITANPPAATGVVNMEVREINKPGMAAAPAAASARPSAAPPVSLDVAIRAPRGVFVRGKGLNVELSLDAHVTGPLTAPSLTGAANVVLGSYDFAGKKFDFDPRGVVYLAARPEQIRLDLTATRQSATLTAVVKVAGTAAKPEISLSSTPVLPPDEVLSQVLFGSSAAQLTGTQAAELASALASLSGGGGFDVLGRLRQFAGLDRLALGQGTSGTGVSGGKYVTDSIYVELTGGGREGPSAAVEWRVRRNLSLISRVGTQGDAQLSIQFRRDYR